jgi:transcription elongation factor GreA
MTDTILSEAADRYLQTVKGASRQAAIAELNRFVRWYGGDKSVGQMRGHDVSLYADVLGPSTHETTRRAEQVRSFLVYMKKTGLTETNLGPHLRLRKGGGGKAASGRADKPVETVELTQAGVDALSSELEGLVEDRIAIRKEIHRAMQDKDFKENSPLDAAKDKQGHIEARIRDIEAMLKRAVIVDGTAHQGRVKVGTHVSVRNLKTDRLVKYSIVGPTEANAADGKISSVSPVGKALLNARVGEEVEVSAPSGMIRLKVEDIEA